MLKFLKYIDENKKERGPCYMCSNGYLVQEVLNISVLNNNRNINYYTTINDKSTPPISNINVKTLDIDYLHYSQYIKKHFNSYSPYIPHSEEILNLQKKILDCNENEIEPNERTQAASLLYLFEISKNKTPLKCNIEIFEKIWKLSNGFTQLKLQFGLSTLYLLPKLYDEVKNFVNTLKKLEGEGFTFTKDGISNDVRTATIVSLAYETSAFLGMWEDMLYLRNKMNDKLLDKSESPNTNFSSFKIDSIYKIISNQIPHSLFQESTIDINKTSEPINESEVYPFKMYEIKEKGLKNPKLVNINYELEIFDPILKKNQILLDRFKNSNYSILYNEKGSLLIIGKAVKLIFNNIIYGGIIDYQSKTLKIYSGETILGDNHTYESQFDCIFESEDLTKSIKLTGTHRKFQINKNQKLYIDTECYILFENKN
ncbi:hypothetical protein DICPUDRAFT_85079 [Dictyostelium purpureum]|uniref:Uncharacterized protein n=1 Tax=Dictyostelium purpureum TaxID=5786 RepID=F1A4M5_DICPU|nr:uncharacterized protein DICPUDRAFT_85079 [Dictyostelium purpureum]EGC28860.1 hypothetical protein DICPUDRAFT_85079 [Dictyostelium purpureum]|eukprot:XP_003294620.1 hypothetical protein DICPUDRAFT_85079 [Dictyostelium purpureum]